jgi:signal transduction histidine kinase
MWIAHEAVRNARTGRARKVVVKLFETSVGLTLEIRDDGCGLPEPDTLRPGGLGLRIMRHRARAIRATLRLSSDATGTTVICELLRRL